MRTSENTRHLDARVQTRLSSMDSWIETVSMDRLSGPAFPNTSDLQSPFLDMRPLASLQMEIASTKDCALHLHAIVHRNHHSQIPDTLRRMIVLQYEMALLIWRTELRAPCNISRKTQETRAMWRLFSTSRGALNIQYWMRHGDHGINPFTGCQFDQIRSWVTRSRMSMNQMEIGGLQCFAKVVRSFVVDVDGILFSHNAWCTKADYCDDRILSKAATNTA